MDPVHHVQSLVEIQNVDAAAQQQMLAVVDNLGAVAWKRVGGGTPTQEPAGFEQIYLESGASERGGGSQSGQAAADNNRTGHGRFSPVSEDGASFGSIDGDSRAKATAAAVVD